MSAAGDPLRELWARHLPDTVGPAELLRHSPVRVVFGPGRLDDLGGFAKEQDVRCVFLVTDRGIVAAGHAERAVDSLRRFGLEVTVFDGAAENPTTEHVDAGLAAARAARPELLVALGGGSAMDCAKGVNLLLANGGRIQDYWGINKTTAPMLPMIAVPTTAGTGSEAQSFALISDPDTHRKMACGDRRPPLEGGLRPRVAVLDPEVTVSQPPLVAAASGIDAIAHAVETAGTTERTEVSRALSRGAWRLLSSAYAAAMRGADDDSRARMLLGAHLGGAAIEQSMLGAAHACANPLTARFNLMHGVAVGIMLPAVVRYNTRDGSNPYGDLDTAEALTARLGAFQLAGGLPARLGACGVPESALPELAFYASEQWTARFNPVPVDAPELLEMYRLAF